MSCPSAYEFIRRIGKGAFGNATLIRRKSDGCQCVLKEILLSTLKDKREQNWARQEVQLLRSFEHPGIVRYFDSFVLPTSLCIVMEFCDGGDLCDRIDNQKMPFAEELIMDWFAQLCLALKYIHDRRIIHRDIKPKNIFLMRNGKVIKLGDFGVAKTLDFTQQLAVTGIGTANYLSPEIVKGEAYNNKTDIWSMGCVLYELLALRIAFCARNVKTLYMNIKLGALSPLPTRYSAELRAICTAMLRKNPKDRPGVGALLKRDCLRPALLKTVSIDTPIAAGGAAQKRVLPINVGNNNRKSSAASRAVNNSRVAGAASPRPGTPGRVQTPGRVGVGGARGPTAQSRQNDARRREAERAAAIRKAYEVKKRPSPAASPLLKQQRSKAVQNKDMERLSKKRQELEEKRQHTYRQEGWVNVLSPRSPAEPTPQQRLQQKQQKPAAAAAAVSAAGEAAVAGRNAAAAGRQAANQAQKLLDNFWERKKQQKAGGGAAAGNVAAAAAEVAEATRESAFCCFYC
uniref:non-specific serine/threonine protein kinase n=1 Tax=Macrostomum lignano TaxID=282301 RepID=A0A1I8FXS9_9PLAT